MTIHSGTGALISRVSSDLSEIELEKASSKYHITGAWIAIIFDPVFAITDYFNIPQNWQQLLVIRLAVSCITLLLLFVRKKYTLPSYVIILVPVLLISLQNSYTFSLISDAVVLGHCLNFMALLIGGAMFILWPTRYSIIMIGLSSAATAFFLSLNSAINANHFFVNGGLLLIAVGVFMIVLIKARYDLTLKEIRARLALEQSNKELEVQKSLVELKNNKITDSINYARRIQESILGHQSVIDKWFTQSLVFFRPKDILSGDFFWFHQDDAKALKIIIVADCTGHGVPAAMMTVLGNSILDEIVLQRKIYEPDKILQELDARIIETFATTSTDQHQVNDGMDVSILCFHEDKIYFAAAKNPLCIIQNNELVVIPGSKFPVGSTQYKQDKIFKKHLIQAEKGTRLFIYTDGYQDQFGGLKNTKFMTKRFRELLRSSAGVAMHDQLIAITSEFDVWKGEGKQTDDVLIIGCEV